MDKGDVLSILAALIVVSVIALVLRPPVAETVPEVPRTPTPTPFVTVPPKQTPAAPLEPVRLSYTTAVWDYPCCHLPGNLMLYGGSDPPWKGTQEVIPFAYVEEGRGGITEVFQVPYAVWRLNCSVTSTIRPQAAHFRMALVDLDSGTIIEGAELHYPGSIIKNVERGGKDFYLIVSVDEVDSYRITLETSPKYFSTPLG
ncbi:hypothetical protein FGW20_07105 [Methanoculleus sp. FWC-SCC3]|uniref:Uncharacterized protein n=1 Tax=Methanoculleus methanifontis TaxID=2584086 RepID=A0ABT8M323_9EURY|nr:hypothetical protein [Methanoculleus sp. FWC-SCC3]MDN7012811.1 hypothetical protein [Methanoculleus sp. FWC-SCC3]